jgi:hypothetical protein
MRFCIPSSAPQSSRCVRSMAGLSPPLDDIPENHSHSRRGSVGRARPGQLSRTSNQGTALQRIQRLGWAGWSANHNVWAAAPSQAKSEHDRLVCANVYGLCWS